MPGVATGMHNSVAITLALPKRTSLAGTCLVDDGHPVPIALQPEFAAEQVFDDAGADHQDILAQDSP